MNAGGSLACILVFDDSPTVVRAVTHTLEPKGHQVHRLECFVDLPRALRETPPDLILLDLEMPAFSGVDFGLFLRRYSAGRYPIVIYSSKDERELLASARRVQAAAVLQKGRPPEALVEVVDRVLNEIRVASALRQDAR
jgi:DNA-binding NarL/FixJ family response regulator